MACVTLKRGHDFDPLNNGNLTPKRRRFCSPQTYIPAPVEQPPSPFVSNTQLTPQQLATRIRQEVRRLQRRRLIPRFNHKDGGPHSGADSDSDSGSQSQTDSQPRHNATSSMDMVAESVNEQMQSIQCDTGLGSGAPSSSQPEVLPGSCSPRSPISVKPDAPLFTMRQVGDICTRLLGERESQLREEYDRILSCKLAEQYEAFLKFNHDHLYKQFKNTPMSYVS